MIGSLRKEDSRLREVPLYSDARRASFPLPARFGIDLDSQVAGMAVRILARSGTGYQELGSVIWYTARWVALFKPSLAAFPKFLE